MKTLLISLTLLFFTTVQAQINQTCFVDFTKIKGTFRPLHGINKGPLSAGGLVDVSDAHRALQLPLVRLHDCHWPNPDVVDMHIVFPDLKADAQNPGSYDFRLTDEYLAKIHATGAPMLYRLGESIEHTSVKRFAHPPADFNQWSQAALGIIGHYNEGWANGARYNIRYWEIWNEPENRPAMWSGSDEDYFRLYAVAARTIKTRYPNLKVGGPSVGYTGKLDGDKFTPSDFVRNFLDFCRREKLPLDFFSWHCYTNNSQELVQRAHAMRQLLNEYGFEKTESHLNEWNYLPGNTWEPILREAKAQVRQDYFEEMSGPKGAAFIAAALLRLQDAPVDVTNLFHGELGGFGLFNEYGVPSKNFNALYAFRELLKTPQRVATKGNSGSLFTIEAGWNKEYHQGVILISSMTAAQVKLQIKGLPPIGTTYRAQYLDSTRNVGSFGAMKPIHLYGNLTLDLTLDLPTPGLIVIQLEAHEKGKN